MTENYEEELKEIHEERIQTIKNNFRKEMNQKLKKIEERIKQIMFGEIDWIKVFKDAYESRKTSWCELGHIMEWRNATDEVLSAVWHQLQPKLSKIFKEEIGK